MNQRSTLFAVVAAISVIPVSRAQAPVYNPDLVSNWPAPLYWQPPIHDSEGATHRGRIRESAVSMAAAPGAGLPAVFVAMSPCRVIDTRVSNGNFGSPAFAAGQTRSFAIPSNPTCPGIPVNAFAYSFNIGVIPQAGTLAWLTAWDTGSPQPTAATLNDSAGTIIANAAIVPAGVPGGSINIFAHDPTHVIVDINGYYLPGADASGNTQLGVGALALATPAGPNNTAVGMNALGANTTGSTNTAIGDTALQSNTIGSGNTAIGQGALGQSTTGVQNTAIGVGALQHNNTGFNNTAIGFGALGASTSGHDNFGIGNAAGSLAGFNGNWNVFIANQGQATDSNLIRIGDSNQNRTFISGISGVSVSGVAVQVDANGQLGVAASSRRFKQDIQDMGDTTSTIMNLHPVQFHYKANGPDSPMQYGLIAEDVAKVAPDLIERDSKGEIFTVHYEKVNAMVLNQVQEQQRLIEKQSALIQQLESRIAELEHRDK
jgi:hypothetical protein